VYSMDEYEIFIGLLTSFFDLFIFRVSNENTSLSSRMDILTPNKLT
jgi:hypothetical protein